MMLINQLENYEQPNNLAVHRWRNLNPLTEFSLMNFFPLLIVRPRFPGNRCPSNILEQVLKIWERTSVIITFSLSHTSRSQRPQCWKTVGKWRWRILVSWKWCPKIQATEHIHGGGAPRLVAVRTRPQIVQDCGWLAALTATAGKGTVSGGGFLQILWE